MSITHSSKPPRPKKKNMSMQQDEPLKTAHDAGDRLLSLSLSRTPIPLQVLQLLQRRCAVTSMLYNHTPITYACIPPAPPPPSSSILESTSRFSLPLSPIGYNLNIATPHPIPGPSHPPPPPPAKQSHRNPRNEGKRVGIRWRER